MDVKLSTKFRNDFLGNKDFREIFEDAVINIYDGTIPESADLAVTGTLLASITKSGAAVSLGEVSTAQEALIPITTHASGEKYWILLNGVSLLYTNTPDLDAAGVATAIADLINEADNKVIAFTGGTANVYVRSKYKGVAFTLIVNSSLIEEPFDNLTAWTVADTGTGATTSTTYGGDTVVEMAAGAAGTATITQDIGTIGDDFVVELKWHQVLSPATLFEMRIDLAGLRLAVQMWGAGPVPTPAFKVYNGTAWSAPIYDPYPTAGWQTTRFVVHGGTPASATVDIIHNDIIIATGQDCSYTGVFTNGTCYFECVGGLATARLDFLNIADAVGGFATESAVANTVSDALRFAAAVSGVIGKDSAVWSGTAVATGTPSYFRIVNSADEGLSDVVAKSYPRIQGDIGVANTAMIRDNMSIASGSVQTITAANITMPAG